MNSQEVQLTPRHIEALERIARDNQMEPEELVRLAVEALLVEVKRDETWLAGARGNSTDV